MEIWIVWLIIIGVLLITEVLTQMMWAMCLAVGCILAIIGELCGISILWQIILAAVGSIIAYAVLIPAFQKWHILSVDKKGKEYRTGMDALLGRKAVISEEVTPERLGRARIDGDNWQVRAAGKPKTIKRGTEVVVTGYESIILEVEPIKV